MDVCIGCIKFKFSVGNFMHGNITRKSERYDVNINTPPIVQTTKKCVTFFYYSSAITKVTNLFKKAGLQIAFRA